MRYFLQMGDQIRIINEPDEFACSFSQFQLLEPLYPALPPGKNVRYWTPEMAYLDGDARAPIDHDCGPYTLKVTEYASPGPFVYAHVTLSANMLCINADPPDSISFECHLKATDDPEDDDLPINYTWNIRLRNENDLFFDTFASSFVNGYFGGLYEYQSGLPLGRYHIEEADFDKLTIGNTTYTVKLLEPLIFTLYRNL